MYAVLPLPLKKYAHTSVSCYQKFEKKVINSSKFKDVQI